MCQQTRPLASLEIISIVNVALVIASFILNMVSQASPATWLTAQDGLNCAGFGSGLLAFILVWFLDDAWKTTFAQYTFGSGVSFFIYMIVGSEAQRAAAESNGLVVAAIVLAAVSCVLSFYCLYQVLSDKFSDNAFQTWVILGSMLLTALCLILWITVDVGTTLDSIAWVNGILIAGTALAGMAIINGLFLENASNFSFYSLAGSCMYFVFFISNAAVEIQNRSAHHTTLIVLAAVNAVLLAIMAYQGTFSQAKGYSFDKQLILLIVALTVLVLALGASAAFNWQRAMLGLGAGCVFLAFFFSFVKEDNNALYMNLLFALISLCTWFIAECIVTAAAGIVAAESVCALVFTAVAIVLIALMVWKTCPLKGIFDKKVEPAEEQVEA